MSTFNNIKAANHDIKFYNGNVFDLSFNVAFDSVNYDLSSKTTILTIKKIKTGEIVTTLSGAEITISGTDNSIVTFNKRISNLEERDYYYDFNNTTNNVVMMYGRFKVTQRVNES